MLAIQLPDGLEERLEAVAAAKGQTTTSFAVEVILEYLEDLEDLQIAESRWADIEAGRVQTVPLEAVLKEHGLAD